MADDKTDTKRKATEADKPPAKPAQKPDAKNASAGSTTTSSIDAVENAKKFLRSQANAKGWWPYKKNGMPSMEATAWCAFALKDDATAQAATRFLVDSQNKDGGWSTAPQAGNSDWVTGPVMLALRAIVPLHEELNGDERIKKSVQLGLEHLTDSRVEFFSPAARLFLLLGGPKQLEYSRGWPWDNVWGCYHFVEPTSYHLMALKIPGGSELGVIKEVIKRANQFLTEHPCEKGGWTYGNETSLGSPLPPFRVTTAEALLALQDLKNHKSIKPALKFLQTQSHQDTSAMSLAWSILALDAYGEKADRELAFLKARQQADGSFSDNMMVNALALMALQAGDSKNPMKLV